MKESTGARRDELHLARRLFHMLSGLGLVGMSFFLESKKEFAWFLAILTIIDLLIEGSRLYFPKFNEYVVVQFRVILREGEQYRLSGIFFYLLGCTIAAFVFPRDIAILSILFLAFGDPIASIVGVKWGRVQLPQQLYVPYKTLDGSLACFAFCSLLTFGVSFFLSRTSDLILVDRLLFASVGGFAATVGEMLPLRTDDNLALPLVSGAILWAISAFFNIFPGLYL